MTAALGFSLFLVDCIDTRSDVARRDGGSAKDPSDAGVKADDAGDASDASDARDAGGAGDAGDAGLVEVAVTVDLSTALAVVAPYHYGMHASVYDNTLHHQALPELLEEAGIGLLRWPGGGYSDNYHFSTHSMTAWADGNAGYLASGSDFGSFVGLVDRVGTGVMITVNYGSNLAGDAPGEPKEAAAWVAYANGAPDDDREIGVDSVGNDWLTVGFWASLRASEPLEEDDGYNFLRIARPEPLGVEYWEIGNEVFGNGFHQDDMTAGFELDLHVSYPGPDDDPTEERFVRYGNPLLSGKTYGAGVRAYAEEMKAVDPTIKIGAVLGTPPADESWMTVVVGDQRFHWNTDVITECGDVIDFGIVHWYPNPPSLGGGADPTANSLHRVAGLLTYPKTVIPVMVSELRDTFARYAGDNADNIEIVMTEVGTGIRVPSGRNGGPNRMHAMGMFAADMILTAAEHGFVNVDWLELHNGTFLNEAAQAKGPAFTGIQLAHLLAGPGDRLVTVTTTTSAMTPLLVAHASLREDGRVGVMLINTQPPELSAATVTVTIEGGEVGASGERYDYFPVEAVPTVPDGGVPAMDGGTPDAGASFSPIGASGTLEGPLPFSEMQSPFTVELPPYGVSLLLFDAAD